MTEPEQTAALKRLIAEKRRIPKQQIVIMLLIVLGASAFLYALKYGAKAEHIAARAEAKKTMQLRIASNREITRAATVKFGGISRNSTQRALVARVGAAIANTQQVRISDTKLQFHLLNEANHIAAYGLSTGDIYVTTALVNRMHTEGELAAALAHATAHALDNDALEPYPTGAVPLWQHNVEQEKAADLLTVRLMVQAGYDPNAFSSMLLVLAGAYNKGADVGFFTSHPNSDGRLEAIAAAIQSLYPGGVPAQLSK